MARTVLTAVSLVPAGVSESFGAVDASGAIIPGTGDHFIHVKNASGSPITVTPQCPNLVGEGLAVTAAPVTVPATTGDKLIGPFRPDVHTRGPALADPGTVYVDFSAVTSVTVALVKIGA